eukprot:Protomagalhaensia_sp_Gyna_25__5655@NODE_799_length_2598_cov_229_554123_g629_i0_p2_GENE_NODE_799_length_2598_cov_229_554123_g629_i0NODE_799_length_2598_cov_229_554123_g629_i0_p2_ORF_typecomplete_len224_score42_47_NODE_799_length_2598_cov_229_554123_g629_i018822553
MRYLASQAGGDGSTSGPVPVALALSVIIQGPPRVKQGSPTAYTRLQVHDHSDSKECMVVQLKSPEQLEVRRRPDGVCEVPGFVKVVVKEPSMGPKGIQKRQVFFFLSGSETPPSPLAQMSHTASIDPLRRLLLTVLTQIQDQLDSNEWEKLYLLNRLKESIAYDPISRKVDPIPLNQYAHKRWLKLTTGPELTIPNPSPKGGKARVTTGNKRATRTGAFKKPF